MVRVHTTEEPGEVLAAVLAGLEPQASHLLVVTDANVRRLIYPELKKALPAHKLVVLLPGEQTKTLESAALIWQALSAQESDRYAVVLALGGGMITDLAGFAASVYKRGVRCVYAPTSLLAMVDAAMGGKTGVDLGGLKNQIGTFAEPAAIIACPAWLQTLPYGELLSGWAEVLKHSLLHSEQAWDGIRKMEPDDPASWPAALELSTNVKASIVEADPTEQGPRRLLNLGHTVAHALEAFYLQQAIAGTGEPILHGHAVALGLLAEAWIANRQAQLDDRWLYEIEETILSQYPALPYTHEQIPAIARLARQDKKNAAGHIHYVALQAPGQANHQATCTEADIRAALKFMS